MLSILDPTGLSPEDLAPRLGISNMTYRRWQKRPADKRVPTKYETAIREGVYRLLAEGKLRAQSPEVADFLKEANPGSIEAAIRSLGVPAEFARLASSHEDQVTLGLSHIGANAEKQEEVDGSVKKIRSFESFGVEWKKRVKTLLQVIRSREISTVDKLVAYGALFYLITPFDLIPDHIPVFGYVDDYAILGFALAYYLKKFPMLSKSADG